MWLCNCFPSLSDPVSNAQSDEIDGLIDKKGGPENMHEFASEADIVVTCLTLTTESVKSHLLLLLLFFYKFVCFLSNELLQISGWHC